MGPPSAGLTNHGIHGNAGGLTSHLAKNKGLGTPATAVMSTKFLKVPPLRSSTVMILWADMYLWVWEEAPRSSHCVKWRSLDHQRQVLA